MIMLLSFFACLTSMLAAMSDSVEMIKIRHICDVPRHNKRFTILKPVFRLVFDQCIPRCLQWHGSKVAGWQVVAVMEDRRHN